ncbi:hypothetical protein LCGC14_1224870, partial [marine sediment metagenome]
TQAFITKHWDDLTEIQRNRVCDYQKLTQPFITKHWNGLTDWQRNCVCECQKLTKTFITQHWKELTEDQRNIVHQFQKLSTSFKEHLINGNVFKKVFIPVKTMRYLDMDFEEF